MVDQDVKEAREKIGEGGIVIFTTETAYGIAADATDPKAVEKVYKAKHRPYSKGLTTIVDSLETAKKYAEITEKEEKIIEELMPGPLTLVTEKTEKVPENLNEDFAFRISPSEVSSELASEGPITATSANISGQETSYSVKDISEELLEKVDHVIDAGKLDPSPTSTIAEVDSDEVVIHREGPIKKQELEKLL